MFLWKVGCKKISMNIKWTAVTWLCIRGWGSCSVNFNEVNSPWLTAWLPWLTWLWLTSALMLLSIKLVTLWWSFVHNVSEVHLAYAEVRYMKLKGGKGTWPTRKKIFKVILEEYNWLTSSASGNSGINCFCSFFISFSSQLYIQIMLWKRVLQYKI